MRPHPFSGCRVASEFERWRIEHPFLPLNDRFARLPVRHRPARARKGGHVLPRAAQAQRGPPGRA